MAPGFRRSSPWALGAVVSGLWWGQKHHGGESGWKNTAYLMVSRKKRRRQGPGQDRALRGPFPFPSSHLPSVQHLPSHSDLSGVRGLINPQRRSESPQSHPFPKPRPWILLVGAQVVIMGGSGGRCRPRPEHWGILGNEPLISRARTYGHRYLRAQLSPKPEKLSFSFHGKKKEAS